MTSGKWPVVVRFLASLLALVTLALVPRSISVLPWRVYTFHPDSFTLQRAPYALSLVPAPVESREPDCQSGLHRPPPSCHPVVPPDWLVTASALADVTHDGVPEWVLLVWRPWRDWPIQRWSPAPSPIAGFHDAKGDSCHLILLDPRDGREIWAGSALPAPLLALAVGDVDGDGRNEVVTLEGDYRTGRAGPATRVDVWRWGGFGFTLEGRSPSGVFHQLGLTDGGNDGILDIVVR